MSAAKSNYQAWLAKAENDFTNIENNLAATRVPWDTVCFHAQQAAEKLLKAHLVYHGRVPGRTHDLVALLTECIALNAALTSRQRDCQRLSYYAVAARYPNDVFDPDEKDAREMIEAARRIQADVLACLP